MFKKKTSWLTVVQALLLLASLASVRAVCPPKFGNCYVLPPEDEWNRPIDTDPVDYMSECTLEHIATTMRSNGDINAGYSKAMLRLDAGVEPDDTYGMAYNIVGLGGDAAPALTKIFFNSSVDNFQHQSDWYWQNGTYATGALGESVYEGQQAYFRFPKGMAIEGWGGSITTDATDGDRHGIVLDAGRCMLYEAWSVERNADSYTLVNTAVFNLSKTLPQRPNTWTSGDAAGLPIFPGVLRYEEIEEGEINHALRFTIKTVQRAFSSPATKGGTTTNTLQAYYGARFRLKESFVISGYSADTRVLLRALKKYGLVLADQGSTAYITANNHPGFGDNLLSELNQGQAGNSMRIPFDSTAWEMVQSPFPIIYSYSRPSTIECNGITSNPSTFTPTWEPDCELDGPSGSSPPTPTAPSSPSTSPSSSNPSTTPSGSNPSTTPSGSPPSSSPSGSSPTSESPSSVAFNPFSWNLLLVLSLLMMAAASI
jgi:hypothetical protein